MKPSFLPVNKDVVAIVIDLDDAGSVQPRCLADEDILARHSTVPIRHYRTITFSALVRSTKSALEGNGSLPG